MSRRFSETLRELRERLRAGGGDLEGQCVTTDVIVAALIPLVVWAILRTASPKMVLKFDHTTKKWVHDTSKMLLWVVALTVLLWICQFVFYRCAGGFSSAFCGVW